MVGWGLGFLMMPPWLYMYNVHIVKCSKKVTVNGEYTGVNTRDLRGFRYLFNKKKKKEIRRTERKRKPLESKVVEFL
jgi:hypothetical protein